VGQKHPDEFELPRHDILAENKLFATVDSTVEKWFFENVPFLLSDTVAVYP